MKKNRKISYRTHDAHGNKIPCITIQGKFLNNIGFKIGDKVEANYQYGKITITKR